MITVMDYTSQASFNSVLNGIFDPKEVVEKIYSETV